jgi:hypothetical protein
MGSDALAGESLDDQVQRVEVGVAGWKQCKAGRKPAAQERDLAEYLSSRLQPPCHCSILPKKSEVTAA